MDSFMKRLCIPNFKTVEEILDFDKQLAKNIGDIHDETFKRAIYNNNIELAKYYIENAEYSDLLKRDEYGYMPLHIATSYKRIEIIKMLLKRLKYDDRFITTYSGNSPLDVARENIVKDGPNVSREAMFQSDYEEMEALINLPNSKI